jgi:tryptophan 2,3-dioxygenase
MSLLPASGFQSAQYRMVEISSTNFINLVAIDKRKDFVNKEINDSLIHQMFEYIYWKAGATELATGKKTLTLNQFEEKYSMELLKLAKSSKEKNLLAKYEALPATEQNNPTLKSELKQLDVNVNINWPLSHYKSAVRYLQKNPEDIAATGGTNWQKYLPPRFQKRVFFPKLWSAEEYENWGKTWVKREVFEQKGDD